MSIFGDAIWVILFICAFVVFLGLCAFVDCLYQAKKDREF